MRKVNHPYQRVKSQQVRLLDVFIYGPLMVGIGISKKPNPYARVALVILGIGTSIYNYLNYVKVRDQN